MTDVVRIGQEDVKLLPTLRAILCTIARSPGLVCAGAAIDCHALGVQTETVAKAVFV
jgi:hypothetical protein